MRKKLSRQRRKSSETAMKALAAAGAIAAGTQAYAAPIRFENQNPVWDWNLGPQFPTAPDQYLDFTLDSANQGGTSSLNYANIKQLVYYGTVQNPTTTVLYTISGAMSVAGQFGTFAFGVDSGTLIGEAGQSFSNQVAIAVNYYGTSYTYIPEGVQTYLGARILIDYQPHYAWMGVVRTGYGLDAFAWGYESEVGVPIPAGAPEPTSLALLALGFCAAAARRR